MQSHSRPRASESARVAVVQYARMKSALLLLIRPTHTAYTFLPYGSKLRPPLLPSNAAHDKSIEALTGQSADAGPFATAEEAANLMQRWLEDYWECKRLEESNSCFEYGGCHKFCWWRETSPSIAFELETHGLDDAADSGTALAVLRERAAADRDRTLDDDGNVLHLRGALVALDGSHHYCALKPVTRSNPPIMMATEEDPSNEWERRMADFRWWRDLRLGPRANRAATDETASAPGGAPGLCRGGALGGPGIRAVRRQIRPRAPRLAADGPPILQAFIFPLLTLAAASAGLSFPVTIAPLGTLNVFHWGLSALMLSMGLSLTPSDLNRAIRSPRELALNAILCFGMMPIAAVILATLLRLPSSHAAGLILLGSVSGGQASNLCALLAGGDLALSVVLTVSTTLLGVLATPALIQILLGASVVVDAMGVLKSIAQLVLLPLALGLAIGQRAPALVGSLRPQLPNLGIAALLILVAGGSANAASLLSMSAAGAWRAHAVSVLLPVGGGAAALAVARLAKLDERAARTLTIETAIKSPTLAFVLARKHFGEAAVAAAPAASMVWLAGIGAVAASAWGRVAVPE